MTEPQPTSQVKGMSRDEMGDVFVEVLRDWKAQYWTVIDRIRAAYEAPAVEPDPNALRVVAKWLVSLDDPPGSPGGEERRRVSLGDIIERARAALEATA